MNGSNGNGADRFMLGDYGLFVTKKNASPLVKNNDPWHSKPTDFRKVRVDILDLWNPKHWAYYQKLWELVGCELVSVVMEEKQFIKDKGSWKVFIRWFLKAMMDPSELTGVKLDAVHEIDDMSRMLYEEHTDGKNGQ